MTVGDGLQAVPPLKEITVNDISQFLSLGWALALLLLLVWFWNSIYIIKEWERGAVLRLGRMIPEAKGAGLRLVFWPIETLYRIPLRVVTLDVPPQDVITRDNVSAKVNAVAYFKVVDPNRALREVENYLYATSQLAQTTLRSVCGQFELDEILSEREKVNAKLQIILDQDTDPWGIKMTKVEVKQVDIPEAMQRAIARQAEAERERRAKIIHAEGEFGASQKLADAARVLATEPAAIQLRYLQTLTEIGTEKNTTVVFPIPIDMVSSWLQSRSGEEIRKARVQPPSVKTHGHPAEKQVKMGSMADSPDNRRKNVRVLGPFDGMRPGLFDLPLQIYDLSLGGCFVNSVHEAPQRARSFPSTSSCPTVKLSSRKGRRVSFDPASDTA